MNPQRSLWSDLPLSTGIATLVCYAGVFNDVIGIEELAARLAVSGREEFYTTLNDLHRRRRIILRDGFAGLPDLEDRAGLKASKIATAHQLINSRLECLRKLGRHPMVKFVGISGSLAASNPTRDWNNRLDLDVFLITRHQCLWLYKILRGIRQLFPQSQREPQLCVNYLIDESNLLIPNRNLFTATEIRNLIPVSGLDTYRKFLQTNSWVNYYYPGGADAAGVTAVAASGQLLNKCFYAVFLLLRSLKWLSPAPLREISFKTDAHRGTGPDVSRAPYGGYQAMVLRKFSRLAKTSFPELLDAELIGKLFPDELSAEIERGDADLARGLVDAGLAPSYSKYA